MKRRNFLSLAGLLSLPTHLFANTRKLTPSQAEGPFYPVTPIPLRAGLIRDTDKLVGDEMLLSGRVVNTYGQPIPDIKVEIWQCDGKGLYDHPRQSQTENFDPQFAGSGAAMTNQQGSYQFRTLHPVPYTGRPPHIHAKLWRGDRELLTTQLYLKGQTETNEWFNVGRGHLQIDPQQDAQNRLAASFEFIV